jgi:hypothetical protein
MRLTAGKSRAGVLILMSIGRRKSNGKEYAIPNSYQIFPTENKSLPRTATLAP